MKKKIIKFLATVATTGAAVYGIYKAVKYYCYDSGIEELRSYGYYDEEEDQEGKIE